MDTNSQPDRKFIIYTTCYGHDIVYRDGGFHCDGPANRDADKRADAAPGAGLHGDLDADAGAADSDAASAVPAAF